MLRKRPKFQINRTVGRQRYIKTPAEPMQISRRTRIPIFNDNIAAYTEPLQAKTVEAYPVKTEEPAFTDEIKQLIDRLEHKEQLNSSLEAFALFAVLIENIPDIKIKLHKKYINMVKNWIKNKRKKADVTAAMKELQKPIKSNIGEHYNQAVYYMLESLYDTEHAASYLAVAINLLGQILNQIGVIDFIDFITVWSGKAKRTISATSDSIKIKNLPNS